MRRKPYWYSDLNSEVRCLNALTWGLLGVQNAKTTWNYNVKTWSLCCLLFLSRLQDSYETVTFDTHDKYMNNPTKSTEGIKTTACWCACVRSRLDWRFPSRFSCVTHLVIIVSLPPCSVHSHCLKAQTAPLSVSRKKRKRVWCSEASRRGAFSSLCAAAAVGVLKVTLGLYCT